jgi:NDP-sugar pyrophosphorylase family protein
MYQVVLANVLHDSVRNVVIVARAEWRLEPTIRALSASSGLHIELIEVEQTTGGPAETVEFAIPHLKPGVPVVVANSDQYVDASLNDFYALCQMEDVAGVILAMEDDDPKWSYVAVDESGRATQVREKKVISPLATVGIYGFSSPETLCQGFRAMRQAGDQTNGEWYVAPSYNYMIADSQTVRVVNLGPIGTVMHGLGIPVDYENFLSSSVSQAAADRAISAFV